MAQAWLSGGGTWAGRDRLQDFDRLDKLNEARF